MNLRPTNYILLAIGIFLSACGSNSKEQTVEINTPEKLAEKQKQLPSIADVAFSDGMVGKVFHNYLEIKMALVDSDAAAVQSAAENLAESFDQGRAELKHLAQQIASTDDIETQRDFFFQFTQQVEPLIKDALEEGKIYKQYCPMAFNNQGAFWLADVEEIRNPYFGEQMLNCGEVQEVIQ